MHKLRSYVLPVAILLGLLFHRWCGILAFLSPYLIFTILFLNFVVNLIGGGDFPAVFRQFGDGVTMTHPHLRMVVQTFQQRIVVLKLSQVGASVLTAAGGFHIATIGVRHELRAVANAENGQAAPDIGQVNLKRALVIHFI